jgi:hypothetical protein
MWARNVRGMFAECSRNVPGIETTMVRHTMLLRFHICIYV